MSTGKTTDQKVSGSNPLGRAPMKTGMILLLSVFRTGGRCLEREPSHWIFFRLLSPGLVAKTLLRNNWRGGLTMKALPNINVVRSAWRRVKKDIKEAIIRDLKPVKDVKGGGSVAGKSKPTTGGTGTTSSH
jgi:hypothetical protein